MPGNPNRSAQFTFAVVGRDEAKTLAGVIEQARTAARPGDRVWFVDSGSRDDSATIARALGVEVISAPTGKGRAVATALERCEHGYICLVDADLYRWTLNIPATLRDAALRCGAEMVVGDFTDGRRRTLQPRLYWPLVEALFPEHGRVVGETPLSGLRVLDASLELGPLPPGYGVETHLNLELVARGSTIETVDLGDLRSPLRGYSNIAEMATDVSRAILRFAVGRGRLDGDQLPAWERWADELIEVLADQPEPGAPADEFLARVASLVQRPLPLAHAPAESGLIN